MAYWKDKVVLVTGGSSGLGRVIADAFAKAGCRLIVAGLEPEAVRQAADEIRATGCDALGIAADITRQEQVESLFSQALTHFGGLDVLVNNAGRSMRGRILDTTPEQFRDLMELNLLALVRCTRAAAAHLIARRGHVVNIGSLAAKSAARWGRRLSGHEVCRGRLFAAASLGIGTRGTACAFGLSGTHPALRRPALPLGGDSRHS